jgi:hypothetical protein
VTWQLSFSGYDVSRVPLAGTNGEIPKHFEMLAVPNEGENRPGVAMSWQVIDGIPRCTEVRIFKSAHGREVLRSDLEGVSLERWLEQASARMLRPIASRQRNPDGTLTLLYDNSKFDSLARDVRHVRRAAANRGPTDEQLQAAVEIYQSADRAPTQAVSEHFGIKHRTASLWIARAREKGFMQPPAPDKEANR